VGEYPTFLKPLRKDLITPKGWGSQPYIGLKDYGEFGKGTFKPPPYNLFFGLKPLWGFKNLPK